MVCLNKYCVFYKKKKCLVKKIDVNSKGECAFLFNVFCSPKEVEEKRKKGRREYRRREVINKFLGFFGVKKLKLKGR